MRTWHGSHDKYLDRSFLLRHDAVCYLAQLRIVGERLHSVYAQISGSPGGGKENTLERFNNLFEYAIFITPWLPLYLFIPPQAHTVHISL